MADYRTFSPQAAATAAEGCYKNRKTGLKVPSYTKKQLDSLYPAGGFSVVGQVGSGREETGELVSADGVSEKVYAVVKLPHTAVRGYICVGQDEYLAVVKDVLLLWLLFALLALLLCAAIGFGTYRAITANAEPESTRPMGVIDAGAEWGEGEKVSVPEKTETKGKQIKVNGIAEMNLVAGQREQNFVFSNPEENPCFFQIEIELRETGEVIYTSNLLPPGYAISKFTLNRALDAGEYPVIVHFKTFSFDQEQRPLNNMDIKTTIKAE